MASELNFYIANSANYHSKTPKTNVQGIQAKFTPGFLFSLTKKHAYEVDTDSLILSHQLHNQGGMLHESISEAGQHMLLAHQLGADEENIQYSTKSQLF